MQLQFSKNGYPYVEYGRITFYLSFYTLKNSKNELDRFERGTFIFKLSQPTNRTFLLGQSFQIPRDITRKLTRDEKKFIKFVRKLLGRCAVPVTRRNLMRVFNQLKEEFPHV